MFEERVTVTVLADGMIEVFAAVNGMGQGIATSLAQLVVDVFERADGQHPRRAGRHRPRRRFRQRRLALDLRRRLGGTCRRRTHASTMRASWPRAGSKPAPHDIDYRGGRFQVRGTDLGIGLFELAATQDGGRIHLESTSAVSGPSWPNGCHICEIETRHPRPAR